MLASWSYDGSQIMLKVADEANTGVKNNSAAVKDMNNKTNHLTSLNHYIPNMEWKLIDFRYRSNLKWASGTIAPRKCLFRYYSCCEYPYPDISYFFAIKRNPSYYLFTLIVPSAFITIVTVIGFFTPHSSTGENTEKVRMKKLRWCISFLGVSWSYCVAFIGYYM